MQESKKGPQTMDVRCPECDTPGEGNGNGISFVCRNGDCRVAAFYAEAVNHA